ncbi:MAG: lactate utilization protein [Candidatus Rokubacteria bacterium]|nr:lactate utilization protein [Candidatus Rokubacteria bacterium]
MATRAEFLDRVRREVRRAPALFEAEPAPRPARPEEAAAALRRGLAERWPGALARFQRELEGVAGVFHRVPALEAVSGLVADLARTMGARELVTWAPAALGVDLGPALGAAGLAVTAAPAGGGEAARLAHREAAARAQIGVTGVDWALAETGTLILVSGAGRPRSTSLLPDTHVAVFGRRQLLERLEQVGIMLEALHADPARHMTGAMINFITGPSRTADIELTLTRGVHGPKDVHAVFVEAL